MQRHFLQQALAGLQRVRGSELGNERTCGHRPQGAPSLMRQLRQPSTTAQVRAVTQGSGQGGAPAPHREGAGFGLFPEHDGSRCRTPKARRCKGRSSQAGRGLMGGEGRWRRTLPPGTQRIVSSQAAEWRLSP